MLHNGNFMYLEVSPFACGSTPLNGILAFHCCTDKSLVDPPRFDCTP